MDLREIFRHHPASYWPDGGKKDFLVAKNNYIPGEKYRTNGDQKYNRETLLVLHL